MFNYDRYGDSSSRRVPQKTAHHDHSMYSRDCPVCRQRVNQMFFKYFDNRHSSSSLPSVSSMSTCCLRYVIFIFSSICVMICATIITFLVFFPHITQELKLSDRLSTFALLMSSLCLLVFLLGLLGSFLMNRLLLRVFGAILFYLLLVTCSLYLYLVIYLVVIQASTRRIVLVTMSAFLLTMMHAMMALAPFSLADTLHKESESERSYWRTPSLSHLSSSTPPIHSTLGQTRDANTRHADIHNGHSGQVRFTEDWL